MAFHRTKKNNGYHSLFIKLFDMFRGPFFSDTVHIRCLTPFSKVSWNSHSASADAVNGQSRSLIERCQATYIIKLYIQLLNVFQKLKTLMPTVAFVRFIRFHRLLV